MDDETLLYNELKNLSDFDCFPIPTHWYKKFGIPPRNPVPVGEYIESNYAMKMAVAQKQLPPIIITEPQQNGKLVDVPDEPLPPVEVITRPFELKEGEPFPAVLPFIRDCEPDEQSHRPTETWSGKVVGDKTPSASSQDEMSPQ